MTITEAMSATLAKVGGGGLELFGGDGGASGRSAGLAILLGTSTSSIAIFRPFARSVAWCDAAINAAPKSYTGRYSVPSLQGTFRPRSLFRICLMQFLLEVTTDIIRPYLDEVTDRINKAEEEAKRTGARFDDEEDWDIPDFWEFWSQHWPKTWRNITWKSLRDVVVLTVRCWYASLIDGKCDDHTAWKLLKDFTLSSTRKANRFGRVMAAPRVTITAARTQLLSTVASFTVIQTWDTVKLAHSLWWPTSSREGARGRERTSICKRYLAQTFKQICMHAAGIVFWSAGAAMGTIAKPGVGSEVGAFISYQVGMVWMIKMIESL